MELVSQLSDLKVSLPATNTRELFGIHPESPKGGHGSNYETNAQATKTMKPNTTLTQSTVIQVKDLPEMSG